MFVLMSAFNKFSNYFHWKKTLKATVLHISSTKQQTGKVNKDGDHLCLDHFAAKLKIFPSLVGGD